jgi:hypothetical protein
MNTQIHLPNIKVREIFADSSVIHEKLGLSSHTLSTFRKDGSFIEGIHYVEVNSRLILYNLPLLIDWLVNRHDPATHQIAISHFQAELMSNQSRNRRK